MLRGFREARTDELLGEPAVKAIEDGHARLLEWPRGLDPARGFATNT
jgi:hypothetical protein